MLIFISIIDTEDQSRFEELYLSYRQLMFFVANKILRDEHLAEDAVHEAFLRIIKILPKIDEVYCHKTRSLVVTIVENIAIDFYRKRKRMKHLSFEEVDFYLGSDELSASLEMNELERAILSLPLIYSSVLRLKYTQGFSTQEISKILEITEDNVRQRLKRARDRLEIILQEGDNDA